MAPLFYELGKGSNAEWAPRFSFARSAEAGCIVDCKWSHVPGNIIILVCRPALKNRGRNRRDGRNCPPSPPPLTKFGSSIGYTYPPLENPH